MKNRLPKFLLKLLSMTERKRKLVFVWNYLEWGGAQIYFLAIMKMALPDWNVRVILPEKSSPDIIEFIKEIGAEYELTTASISSKPANSVWQKLQRQVTRIRSEIVCYCHLRKYLSKKNIIHIEAAPWQSWILLSLLARKTNVFVTVHNALSRVSKWRETVWKIRLNFLSKLNDFHVFTANTDAKNSLKTFVSPNFWKKITVTYASINPLEINKIMDSGFSKSELCHRLNLPLDAYKVLCVGQFVDRKGRWEFLRAAENIAKRSENIIFIWLMPKLPDESEQKKIETFDLRGSFFPVLSSEAGYRRVDVLNFFRLADVFVLASFLEGLPISLLEAMALKIPCITTNVNSIPEAVKHKETGMLIESGDSDSLSQAIIELKYDSELRNYLGNTASAYVYENFDERKMAEIAIKKYSDCFLRPETKNLTVAKHK